MTDGENARRNDAAEPYYISQVLIKRAKITSKFKMCKMERVLVSVFIYIAYS